MVLFFASLLRVVLQAFRSKRTIISEMALLKKENEILRRRLGKKSVQFDVYEKLFLIVLNGAVDITHQLTAVKPETVLCSQRTFLKRSWSFQHPPAKRGRKPIETDVKDLILSMNNDSLLWCVKRFRLASVRTGVEAPNMNSIMEQTAYGNSASRP